MLDIQPLEFASADLIPTGYTLNGQTWYQWARELFEFANCGECGRGVRGHLPAIVMGNWFALCKPEPSKTA